MIDQCYSMKFSVTVFTLVIFTLVLQVSSQGQCSCNYSSNNIFLKCDTQALGREIVACFEKHEDVKNLFFMDSGLRVIPHEVRKLKRLTSLNLSKNKIDTFNLTSLGDTCKRLESLSLSYNEITELKEGSMDCLTSLKWLSLANNAVSYMENGTFNDKLKALTYINIRHNSLTTLDSSMIMLPQLYQGIHIDVYASWNNINLITNSINVTMSDIHSIGKFNLYLRNNNFTDIHSEYYKEVFQIDDEEAKHLLWNITRLDLRFNPLLCDCSMVKVAEMLAKLRPVMSQNNPLFYITCYKPANLFGMLIHKVPLNQFNCTVTRDCPRGCSCTKTDLISVNCGEDYNSSTLPERIPEMNSSHVNIKSDRLKELSKKDYLTNTTLLDVSGCAVFAISPDILLPISRIQTVYLHDNALAQIPKEIEHVRFTGLQSLTLSGNPFACDCHSLWFKKWLLAKKHVISDINRVHCGSGPGRGNQIIKVPDSAFVCEHSFTLKDVLITAFSVIFFMTVVFGLVYKNRVKIHLLMIAYFNVNCFRRKAEGDFPFDVFICHSSIDYDWVIETLLKKLENLDPPYKTFFGERDFQPGKTIIYNVIRAITLSRTTLLILNNNFLRSEWCMMEFRQAYLKQIKDNDINLIVIVMEELDETLIGLELKFYLRTNVYIKYTDKYFWAKLLQALPLAPSTDTTRQSSDERIPLLEN